MRTLIRGAEVVFSDQIRKVDVLFDQDRILDVDASKATQADEIIEAHGLHLMPGVIDDQVHFREPGLTHKEDLATASHACAAGGVTTFLEMPNTKPPAITVAGVREKEALAASKSLVNYGFYIGATVDNVAELKAATEIPGIKIFIGSSTGSLLVDQQEALEQIFAESTLPICAHCEDEATVRQNQARYAGVNDVAIHSKVRDHLAARLSTARSIDLAQRHRHRFHVLHVSTADEVPLLAKAGPYVTSEVCPHHLFFNVDDYARLGTRIQMNPSIKTRDDNAALFQALADGVIQVMATDHAPHTLEEKAQPYPQSPSGLPAVENFLALMLNQVNAGRWTLTQLVHWMSDAPARVWGITGKGRIAVGYDSDLVLVNMNQERTIRDEQQHTKSKWSPWHGESLKGWPVMTWVSGTCVYNHGQFHETYRGRKPVFEQARGSYYELTNGIGPRDRDYRA